MDISFTENAWEDYLYWQKITDEHRLVYQVEGNNLIVYTCRYHY